MEISNFKSERLDFLQTEKCTSNDKDTNKHSCHTSSTLEDKSGWGVSYKIKPLPYANSWAPWAPLWCPHCAGCPPTRVLPPSIKDHGCFSLSSGCWLRFHPPSLVPHSLCLHPTASHPQQLPPKLLIQTKRKKNPRSKPVSRECSYQRAGCGGV